MLDELAHAGPEHLDEGFIAGFDRKQGYPDAADDIAALAAHGLGRTSTVVDFGAGTGQFAIPAARRFGRVTAVDVSPAMLAALAVKAGADAAVKPAIECVRGGFLSYFPAAPVDGVYTRHALHLRPGEPPLGQVALGAASLLSAAMTSAGSVIAAAARFSARWAADAVPGMSRVLS